MISETGRTKERRTYVNKNRCHSNISVFNKLFKTYFGIDFGEHSRSCVYHWRI